MLVLVNLDIFAQLLAAWHTNIEPHKLPECSSKSSMLAMAADTGNSEPLCSLWWLMDVRCYVIALLAQ